MIQVLNRTFRPDVPNTPISVAETEQPKPWIRDRQLPRCLEIAVKSERKISGCYRLIGKCTFHGTKSIQPGSGHCHIALRNTLYQVWKCADWGEYRDGMRYHVDF